MAGLASGLRAVTAAVTIACWLMSIYKLRDLARDRHNASLRALCVALLGLSTAMTLQPVAHRVDLLTGVLDLGRVTANCLSLFAVVGAQAFLLYLTAENAAVRRRVRTRYAIMTVGVTAVAASWAVTPKPYHPDDPIVTSGEYAYSDGYVGFYTYLYLALLAWGVAECGLLATRYAAAAPRPLLRLGLRMITAGTVLALAYVILKLVQPVVSADPGRSAIAAGVVASFSSSVLVTLIGSTIPSWGPWIGLDRLWDNLTSVRTYRQLTPLWQALRTAHPDIVLMAEPVGVHGVLQLLAQGRLRVIRRIVEINDGLTRLSPYADIQAAITVRARISDDHDAPTDAVVHAILIADALRRHHAGLTVPSQQRTSLIQPPHTTDTDPDFELARLVAVSRAYHQSPRPGPDATTGTGPQPQRTRPMTDAPPATTPPPTTSVRTARALTEMFAPAVLATVMPIIIAVNTTDNPLTAAGWAALAVTFCALIPYTIIWIGVRRGRLTDHHIGVRAHRRRPLLYALTSVLTGLTTLIILGAPRPIIAIVVVMFTVLLAVTTINLAWKLSAHAAVSTGSLAVLVIVFGPWALTCVPQLWGVLGTWIM